MTYIHELYRPIFHRHEIRDMAYFKTAFWPSEILLHRNMLACCFVMHSRKMLLTKEVINATIGLSVIWRIKVVYYGKIVPFNDFVLWTKPDS